MVLLALGGVPSSAAASSAARLLAVAAGVGALGGGLGVGLVLGRIGVLGSSAAGCLLGGVLASAAASSVAWAASGGWFTRWIQPTPVAMASTKQMVMAAMPISAPPGQPLADGQDRAGTTPP